MSKKDDEQPDDERVSIGDLDSTREALEQQLQVHNAEHNNGKTVPGCWWCDERNKTDA